MDSIRSKMTVLEHDIMHADDNEQARDGQLLISDWPSLVVYNVVLLDLLSEGNRIEWLIDWCGIWSSCCTSISSKVCMSGQNIWGIYGYT